MQKRKIPMRKCVASNEMHPKKNLLRVVRTKEGEVFVDLTVKKSGRGAYISKVTENILQAKKKHILDRHLDIKVPDEIYDEMIRYVEREKLFHDQK